ncbi:MAG: dTDP-4-dehydrorhamnose 3,5-epimerase family protein, partial [Polaribacter sp.]
FKNVSLGFFYRILNMGIVFITIPLLLSYLDNEQYRIWVTIFSLVNMVFFVDIGIGNGLKTKLTEALSIQNFKLAKTYISTAYISISVISLVIFCIATVLIFNFNFQKLFNTTVLSVENKKQLFVPRGFAHGYSILEDNTVFVYKCDSYYQPSSEGGIRYNEEELNIDRGLLDSEIQLSKKEKLLKSIKN